jgi:hypothetical protein
MGFHVYCITPASHLPVITGIEGRPVAAVQEGSLAAWVSEHDARPEASVESAKRHNEVVVSAMTQEVTPVPVRFGQWLRDDAALRESIRTSHDDWMERIRTFGGAAEYGIRIFDPAREADEAAATATTGTEYMAALARKQKRAGEQSEAVAALSAAVSGLVADEKIEALRTGHGVASVAHLVHPANLDAYREAVDQVRTRMPELRLLSSGPWPPYSFV